MKNVVTIFIILTTHQLTAQYWFGPKFGYSYIDHVYQESTYERDSFNVPTDYNFQVGAAFSYTATSMYAVYGELLYERVDKSVRDIQTNGEVVNTEMTNHFISAPIMLRVTMGSAPFHYFINGGPRLGYWLGGKCKQDLEEFSEFLIDDDGNPLVVEYDITFNSSDALAGDRSTALVSKPNRLQFGLTLGGGFLIDIQGGYRLQLDFRYTWIHSNMGTNNGSLDTNFDNESYRENLEYYHNIATVGVAFLFDYNSKLRKKGRSTSGESNKKSKK